MQKTRTTLLIVLIVAFIAAAALGSRNSGAQPSISIGVQWGQNNEVMPITDYDAAKRTDAKERARKFSNRHLVLTEEPLDGVEPLPLIDHQFTRMPALPVEQSDAIIVGDVTATRAYLSDDKTGVFSEFIIGVREVLKTDSRHSLTPADSIVGLREGGAVRYPSGRILRFSSLHEHFPESGKRYAFFLKYAADSNDFEILTGYEFKEGAAFPLDGPRDSSQSAELAFTKYAGVSIDQFLYDLRKAISNVDPGQKGGK